MFRMPPFCLYDPRLPDYYRQFRDELKARVEGGYNAYPDEKCRLIWLGELFNYADPFSILEKDGVISPVYEEGPGISSGRRIMEFDKQYERQLSPLEEEARAFASAHWGGPVEWRLNDTLKWAKIFKADGAIHMTQPGCLTCAGSAQIIAEELESKLGIPTLIIEGHIQDFRKYNQEEIESQLEEFKNMLIQKKQFAQNN
jgi:benzoyl-CoA reductase/2-hydroxyglutaryl-CoA dehydratase subunit BcrC/BadD/HgdB